MTTTAIGKDAENLVAEQLQQLGHEIVAMNWRTRWCEIDIVSKTKACVYFTEVKYRSSDEWGEGMEYITPKKFRQVCFAAEMWLGQHDWTGDCMLQCASVSYDHEITIIEMNS